MKVQAKTNIHNKFRIEVKDTRTNEVKQEGFAENIVLDRMYTRLINFSPFFTYIHIGGGSGTLSPDRTALFTPITYKSAVVDEKIKSYPISSVTKRIVFGTTEQNGKTFTEVGISEATSAINTHALIRDAEGNLLSITKTDTDEITIYATIFFELIDDPNSDGKFNQIVTENSLVAYVIDGSVFSPELLLSNHSESDGLHNYIAWQSSTKALTRVSDINSKKNTYSTRIDVGDSNYDIRQIALGDAYSIDIENSQGWGGYMLQDVNIGTGDGTTTDFNIKRYDVSGLSAKVDGITASNFSLLNIDKENMQYIPLFSVAKKDTISYTPYYPKFVNNIRTQFKSPERDVYIDFQFELLDGVNLSDYNFITSLSAPYNSIVATMFASHDGENFSEIYKRTQNRTSGAVASYAFAQDYKFLRFTFYFETWNPYASYARLQRKTLAEPTIAFNNPPPVGVPITASYTVPYIPKTKDYVLDLELELLW